MSKQSGVARFLATAAVTAMLAASLGGCQTVSDVTGALSAKADPAPDADPQRIIDYYGERYRANPFSREHVRHILTWYAQKHPDEDFAETFAVWLSPDLDWRAEYSGWPALRKIEYVDDIMREIADAEALAPAVSPDDLPVEAMTYSVAEHYQEESDAVPIEDERQFDVDLRQIFVKEADAPAGEPAAEFLRRHYREVVARVAFWTSEPPSAVRSLIDVLQRRVEALSLRVGAVEAATLIELTAFSTAVVMLHRQTQVMGRARKSSAGALV